VTAHVDDHEIRAFVRDLRDLPSRVIDRVPPVVKRGAVNVKKQLQEEMGASASFAALAPTITFDMLDGGFTAEIGPVKSSSGSRGLGFGANIAYFGGANGGGGTVPDPQGALDAEAPRFEKALADILDGVL